MPFAGEYSTGPVHSKQEFEPIPMDDLIRLARLSATKALDRSVEVKWVYRLADLCDQTEINEIIADAQIAATIDKNKNTDLVIIDAPKANLCHEAAKVSEAGELRDGEKFFLTSSMREFKDLRALGVTPTAIALGH